VEASEECCNYLIGLISLWLDMTGLHVKPLDALMALPSWISPALIQTQLGRRSST